MKRWFTIYHFKCTFYKKWEIISIFVLIIIVSMFLKIPMYVFCYNLDKMYIYYIWSTLVACSVLFIMGNLTKTKSPSFKLLLHRFMLTIIILTLFKLGFYLNVYSYFFYILSKICLIFASVISPLIYFNLYLNLPSIYDLYNYYFKGIKFVELDPKFYVNLMNNNGQASNQNNIGYFDYTPSSQGFRLYYWNTIITDYWKSHGTLNKARNNLDKINIDLAEGKKNYNTAIRMARLNMLVNPEQNIRNIWTNLRINKAQF